MKAAIPGRRSARLCARINEFGLLIACFATSFVCAGQTPAADSFNPDALGIVLATALQADDKVLVGGSFTTLSGQPRYCIGRLNPEGALDPVFAPGASNGVCAFAVQADGRILLGGSFTSLVGQARSRLGRLNPDGSLDGTFNPNASDTVNCLAVQADGQILVAGAFTSLNGSPRKCFGRLSAAGGLDPAFGPEIEGGSSANVYSLALQADGKILVGGLFSKLNGVTRTNIGRFNADGTLDTAFNPGADGSVYSLAVQADGRILVGGSYSPSGGGLRRLNADGTPDTTFNPGALGVVNSLALQTDGRILLGGIFNQLGPETRNHIGRLNSDGTVDSTFNPGADGSFEPNVSALAVQGDGKVVVGGSFTTLGGQTRNRIGRLNNTEPATQSLATIGSTLTWLRGGTSPEVWRTSYEVSTNGADWLSLGDGERIPGGWQLTGVVLPTGATLRARGFVAGGRYNGSTWTVEASLGPVVIVHPPDGLTNNAGTTAAFSVLSAGELPRGFQWRKDGVPLTNDWNIFGATSPILTLSSVLGTAAGAYSVVVSNTYGSVTSLVAGLTIVDPIITSQPTNKAVNVGQSAAFSVTAIGSAPLSYQWRKDGVDLPGRTGVLQASDAFPVSASLLLTNAQPVDAGGYQVVLGNSYGMVTSAVASLTVNQALPDSLNPGANSVIYALAAQADGKILVGGFFTTLGGQAREHIGRLNADGTLDTTFNPRANGTIFSLAVEENGQILIGGNFVVLGGQPRGSIGRLNPDDTLDATFNPNADGEVYSLAVQEDGKILVGGIFSRLGGQRRKASAASTRMVRWIPSLIRTLLVLSPPCIPSVSNAAARF